MTGRAVSNLSRTLATMERYGMVKMVEGEGRAKAPRLVCDHIEIVMAPLTSDMEAAWTTPNRQPTARRMP